MLVAIQFPIADCRPFLTGDGGKAALPGWPFAVPSLQFVRSSGMVAERRRGGLGCLPYENLFSYGHNALRLPDALSGMTLGTGKAKMRAEVAFRRFFSDGGSVMRYEIGFSRRARTPAIEGAEAEDALALVRDLLQLKVRVTRPQGAPEVELGRCGPALANHYRLATTEPGQESPIWSLASGAPVAIVEYEASEIASIPSLARAVALSSAAGPANLSQLQFEWEKDQRIGVWFFKRGKDVDPAFVRGMRLCLFRLHAERECLKSLLRLIAAKKLAVSPRSPESDELQQYLLDSIQRLNSRKWIKDDSTDTRFVPPNQEFLDAAYQADDFVLPGERVSLLAQLGHIRGNILRAIASLTEQAPINVYAAENARVVVAPNNTGEIQLDKNIHFGDGAHVEGSVVAADDISNSFNVIDKSDASEDLKNALKELTKLVEQLKPQLTDPAAVAKVDKNLKMLTTEAVAKEPDKAWYTVSAEGLVDAAKAVAGLAAPVATAVKTVLGFLV